MPSLPAAIAAILSACSAVAPAAPSFWDTWPFGPGYGESMLAVAAKAVFLLLILGGVVLFLRVLFGPKGFFREKEWDRDNEQEARQELAELERQFAAGTISETEHRLLRKRLIKWLPPESKH